MRKHLIIIKILLFQSSLFSQGIGDISGLNVYLRFNEFDTARYNRSLVEQSTPLSLGTTTVSFNGNDWKVNAKLVEAENGRELLISLTLQEGMASQTAPSLDFEFSRWSKDGYLLLPGAAYNGNRFESRRIRYSPKLMDPRDYEKGMGAIVSDIPRLNVGKGPSRIQERSGSLTTPAIGWYSPQIKANHWVSFSQKNKWGDFGITIEENPDRSRLVVSLTSPVVREYYKYRITDRQFPSDDIAPTFYAGDQVNFRIKIHRETSNSIVDLFKGFYEVRKSFIAEQEVNYSLPLSACFEAQEEKFNAQNFVADFGYYAVGMRDGKYKFLQDWQIGWTGGMISTLPLLFAGGQESESNVISNFNFLFPQGICPAGFFWDAGESSQGVFTWIGGDPRKTNTANWHLIRKSGDAIYYIVKQLDLMKRKGLYVDPVWENGLRHVCESIVKLWRDNGDFGQFVDSQSGKIQVYGSTSGAIIPAGLSLASEYFDNEDFLLIAKESAEYYYQNFIAKGITSGGPGDAMQNPDSESSYAMLESFMILHGKTGDPKWKEYAVAMAHQFSSWVMSYDYEFPPHSTLGKLNIKTTGSVYANTQNKHGAPGICTHSGIALLRLFRATGDTSYLELLQDITQHIPQNLSHPLKPIEGMQPGWMSERVSTTDWYEGIGELMYGSTWAETALMLTYVEIPGVYVQPDKALFYAFDQLKVEKKQESTSRLVLAITNPTPVDAVVKLYAESSMDAGVRLPNNYLWGTEEIKIKAGQTITKSFTK